MMKKSAMVISALLYICLPATTLPQGNYVYSQPNETLQCCTSYYEENGTCQECIGSFGTNCVQPCNPGYCGPKCKIQCSCSDNENDKIIGCPKEIQEEENVFQDLKRHSSIVITIVIILTFILLLYFTVALKVRNVREKMHTKKNPHYFPNSVSGYTGIVDVTYSYAPEQNISPQ